MTRRPALCPPLRPSLLLCCLALVSGTGCGLTLMPTPNLLAYHDADQWARVPEIYRTNTVEVVYATDRDGKTTADGIRYGIGRSRSLAYGVCTVQIGNELSWEKLVALSTRPRRGFIPLTVANIEEVGRFPETPWAFEVVHGRAVTAPEVLHEHARDEHRLRQLIAARLANTDRKEAYIYVHGFNNYFDDAASILAEFWHFAGRQGVPIVYSWPAGGGATLRTYNKDRESGEFSVFHLKQFLETVIDTPGLEKIHLIGHSLGTEVLTSALRELRIKYEAQGLSPAAVLKIGNLVLAAPDIDLDVAAQRLSAEHITRVCERLTVYASPQDRALAMANYFFRGAVRLGTLTMAELAPDRRLALSKLRAVSFINAKVASDWIGHSYFYKNPAVSSDLILLIRDGRDPGAEHGRPLERDVAGFWTIRDSYLKSRSDMRK